LDPCHLPKTLDTLIILQSKGDPYAHANQQQRPTNPTTHRKKDASHAPQLCVANSSDSTRYIPQTARPLPSKIRAGTPDSRLPTPPHDRCPEKSVIFRLNICHEPNAINTLSRRRGRSFILRTQSPHP
jgi:hypothetical protein